jgi:tRNA A-37 threonylcarbamoyl transferase component Bud32
MSEELAPGTVLANSFRVVRKIGSGGMGDVYEVAHLRLAGRYALKLLQAHVANRPDVIARFRREAEITSSLRHPNIVKVIDFNSAPDGRPYLVMEYLDGVELGAAMAEAGAMTPDRAIDIVGQVASALTAAHALGVVHRDLKPQNLFLVPIPGDDRPIVKVVDFGISKMREAAIKLTADKMIVGTPQYMSPEQARGRVSQIDHRTDQFALGVITYELLAGREAFSGEDVVAVLHQVINEAPAALGPLNPAVTPALEAVVMRALDKERDRRWDSVKEYHQALLRTIARARAAPTAGARRAHVDGGAAVDAGTRPPDGAAVPSPSPAPAPPWAAGRAAGRRAAKVTTLKSSAGAIDEVALEEVVRPRRPGVKVAAAAVLLAAMVAWLALSRGGGRAGDGKTGLAAPATPRPATIHFPGLPRGTRVLVDGRDAELPLVLERGSGRRRVRFEAAGYAPLEIPIDPDAAEALPPVELAPLAPERPASPPRPPAATPAPTAVSSSVVKPARPPEGGTAARAPAPPRPAPIEFPATPTDPPPVTASPPDGTPARRLIIE